MVKKAKGSSTSESEPAAASAANWLRPAAQTAAAKRTAKALGNRLTTVAMAWQVQQLTGSPGKVGLLGLCAGIPYLLFSMLGGAFADKLDRRRILVGSGTFGVVTSVLLFANAASSRPQVWVIFVLATVRACQGALASPARMSLAPLLSGSLSATYERDIGYGLMGRANVTAKANSHYNTGSDLNPVKVQRAYQVINARLGVGPRDNRWSLELWAQNLMNETYMQVAFDATAQSKTYNAFLGQPRTVGVTGRVKY
jgi:hypothetical protein